MNANKAAQQRRGSADASHAQLANSDPVMAAIIERVGEMSFERRRRGRPRGDSYGVLLRTVVGQQLSAKAAATIFDRLLDLFAGKIPSPAELLAVAPEQLRAIGLSGRKVEYVRDLATHVESGALELDRLGELSDEEVIAEITAIRGFGLWSAQMFLIFHLERPDVLPTGDLGVRRAAQVEYGLQDLPDHDELTRIAEPWRPRRTLASLYLWETLANVPVE
jgi:DNA-3-methyladenine glycosylase II